MPAETSKQQLEAEDENAVSKSNKRRQPNKYSLTNDNKHSLRRDLLLSNFDRTMTVEKARFEPNTHDDLNIPSPIIPKVDVTSNPEPVASDSEPVPLSNNNNSLATYALTMSPSAPTLSTAAAGAGGGPPPSTTLSNDRKRLMPVKSESNQSNNNSISNHTRPPNNKKLNKKPSKNAMHHYGTASPAEVFHRNLVDAVSNVDDSDENEHYVYPYSGNESCTTIATNNNGLHRPLSVRSTPAIFNQQRSIGDWIRRTWSPRKEEVSPMPEMEEEEVEWSGNEHHYRRPKLRNRVIDHPPHRSNSLLNLWHDSFNKKYGWPTGAAKKSHFTTQKSPPFYHHGGGGYTSDEEDAPLLRLKRQQQQQQKRLLKNNNKKQCKRTIWKVFLALLLILIGFFFVIVYRAQALTDLTVDIGRVLATDKELIFDLKVQAENWNWWTIHIADADISVFAFSQIVPSNVIIVSNASLEQLDDDVIDAHTRGVDPAEYLGNLKHFDEPLSIRPNRLNNREAISQIRIKSPGADISGNERWSRMIRYPYGLVIRGVLKYKPVPFLFGGYPQSAAVCNVTRVDPTTGIVSSEPDKSFCVSQDQVNIFSHELTGL